MTKNITKSSSGRIDLFKYLKDSLILERRKMKVSVPFPVARACPPFGTKCHFLLRS